MISIVICSVNEQLARQVKRNIDETIGVPWELILIDNTILKKGITTVYNLGASRARFEIICFVHEDVLFKTMDWGKEIVSRFAQDPALGLIGVAGSKYKTRTLSGWVSGHKEFDCCNILHHDSAGALKKIWFNPDPSKDFQEVVVTDGVFMCVPKRIWQQIPHDETLVTGFHLYDIDYSYRISRSYKAAVTFNIDITHLTQGGDFGNNWLDYTIKWHQHYRTQLPAFTREIPEVQCSIESVTRRFWLSRLMRSKISLVNKFRWLSASGAITDVRAWPGAGIFMVYSVFKKGKRSN